MDKAVKTVATVSPAEGDRIPLTSRLSTKFLALTVFFIMLAEILIFFPSVASMRCAGCRTG